MCTGTGFYPNAYNCRSYFQCTSPGNAGIAKQCPNGQVFDPMANNNGNQCKVSNGINGCIEAQCGAGAGNILLNYPGYSKSYGSYAVVCGGQQPAVYRCEDGFQPNLDTFPIVCTGTCPGSNKRAVDPANPNGYYSCSTSNGKHVGAQRVCPGAQNAAGVLVSQLYNRETKKCEQKEETNTSEYLIHLNTTCWYWESLLINYLFNLDKIKIFWKIIRNYILFNRNDSH